MTPFDPAVDRADADPGLPSEVVFLGGRSGVGKTSVAAEVSRILAAADVRHALIEGDNLDQAHPEPWRHGIDLAEQNLAAMWANYRRYGYTRLIYTNTVSVLEAEALAAVLGPGTRWTAVLLTGDDLTVRARLSRRERGSALDAHLARSTDAAARLRGAPGAVEVGTDGRGIVEVAGDVVRLTGWLPDAGVTR